MNAFGEGGAEIGAVRCAVTAVPHSLCAPAWRNTVFRVGDGRMRSETERDPCTMSCKSQRPLRTLLPSLVNSTSTIVSRQMRACPFYAWVMQPDAHICYSKSTFQRKDLISIECFRSRREGTMA
jgi:hypothetical protein